MKCASTVRDPSDQNTPLPSLKSGRASAPHKPSDRTHLEATGPARLTSAVGKLIDENQARLTIGIRPNACVVKYSSWAATETARRIDVHEGQPEG